MKRLHVHLAVADLEASIRFYSALFAAEPAVVKPDYAKWMLDDPRVNFAISTRSRRLGLDHLGIQAENEGELQDVYGRLQALEAPVLEQGSTTCCYAQSEKSWALDPQGVAWEAFLTMGEAAVFGEQAPDPANAACCTPQPVQFTRRADAAPAGAGCCGPQGK